MFKPDGFLKDKNDLKPLKKYPLSDTDIQKVLEPDTKIITYPELYKYNHIDEIFDDKGRAIMLYLTENDTTGHWVGLIKKGNVIEMYDPYGFKPDTQPENLGASKAFNKEHGQLYPKFTQMVNNDGYRLIYNKVRSQPFEADVNTCGRHVLTRILLKNLSLNKYNKLLSSIKKNNNINPDDLITAFTQEFIGK